MGIRAGGIDGGDLKMSDLVAQSGVSRELVHHYLREGLLPRPERAACYGDVHLRLLGLIKRLRDERFLPLEVIRAVVTYVGHDPDQLELVLLSGSDFIATAQRAASTSNGAARLSAREIEAASGASRELVARCITAALVPPHAERWSRADATLVALVRHGLALGIPFDSFRTIRRYVEMAFALERVLFLPRVEAEADLARLGREVALRKELANAFVASVLGGLVERELAGALGVAPCAGQAFAARLYRPSDAFLRKHGVLAALDELDALLRARPRDPKLRAREIELLALAGRHREIVFAIEQARARRASRARYHGYALLCIGEPSRAVAVLDALGERAAADPLVLGCRAVAHLERVGSPLEAALPAVACAATLAEASIDAARATRAADADEAQMLGGLVLASLPASAARVARGVQVLAEVFTRASPEPSVVGLARAARLRLRIASACLLHGVLARDDLPAGLRASVPARGELCAEVLCLDPASEAALELYNQGGSS